MHNPINMEVYIEKKVLDLLNNDFLKENLTLGQEKLRDILHSYDGITFYTDFTFGAVQFENYKIENQLFTKIIEKNTPVSIPFNEFMSTIKFSQTIAVELNENFKHRGVVESKGGLYFTYSDYEIKIETILFHFHKRIDLSEKFEGWHKTFTSNSLKLNEIIINDNYLLDSLSNIEAYLKPLVNAVKKQNLLGRVLFLTNFLNKNNFEKEKKEEELKANLKTCVKIIHNNFNNFSNHDRVLYTNFLMIDCPVGFNQVHKISNSVITIHTVFDQFTYKRRRKHYDAIETQLI
jgi:hypothetical protein